MKPEDRSSQGASGKVQSTKVLLTEEDVRLSLNILELLGFGDKIDNKRCWQPISDYIQEQFDKYLLAETRINSRVCQILMKIEKLIVFISTAQKTIRFCSQISELSLFF